MIKTTFAKNLALLCLIQITVAAPNLWAQPSESSIQGIEEIVVTARKRQEGLQDTPISITAFTADSLEAQNITNIGQIADVTPNLTINTSISFSGSPSSAAIFLRGVGQVDFTLNTDPGVGLYVDGIYISRSIGGLIDLVDVERIEVLRGPQGTLFGRNTIGGAINVTSKAPTDELGGRLKATVGSDSRLDVLAELNAPLSDTVLTRLAIQSNNRDGYVERLQGGNALGDDGAISARGTLLFAPSENLSFQLALDYTREREESAPFVLDELRSTSLFPGFHNAVVAPMLDPSVAMGQCFDPTFVNPVCFNEASVLTNSPFQTNGTDDSVSDVDVLGVSLTVKREWNDLTFLSMSAYREVESFSTRDGDHSPVLVNATTDLFEYEQLSQEFQLLGSSFENKLNWILGLYYFDEEGNNPNTVSFAPIAFLSGGNVKNQSTAVFGQGTYDISDKLSLTLGLRYTDDTREFTPDQVVLTPGLFPVGTRVLPNVPAETSANDVTPMVNLSYQWSDNVLTYLTFSEGFKSGGFTQRVFPPLFPAAGQNPAEVIPSFEPEFVEQYELGWKASWWDRRVQLNGALFFTDYTDLQINVQRGIAPTTENAAEAEIKGGELEFVMIPSEGFLFNLGIGYTDAEYKSLDATVIGVTTSSKLPGASEWTGNLGLSYTHQLNNGSSLTSRIGWSYRSEFFFDATNAIGQDDYNTAKISFDWESANDDWQVSLFGDNITDEEYRVAGASIIDPGGFSEVMYARPAEWGLSIQRHFGQF